MLMTGGFSLSLFFNFTASSKMASKALHGHTARAPFIDMASGLPKRNNNDECDGDSYYKGD